MGFLASIKRKIAPNTSKKGFCTKLLGYLTIGIQFALWANAFWMILIELIPVMTKGNAWVDLPITALMILLFLACFRSFYLGITTSSELSQNLWYIRGKKIKDFCKNCQISKVETVSHCSTCDNCVIGLDHHCFFLGRCVGTANYAYFLSYAFYALILCLVVIYLLFWDAFYVILMNLEKVRVNPLRLVILYFVALVMALFTCSLICFHFYLILNNMTTVDSKYNKKEEVFEVSEIMLSCICFCRRRSPTKPALIGTFYRNWERVFASAYLIQIFYPKKIDYLLEEQDFKIREGKTKNKLI